MNVNRGDKQGARRRKARKAVLRNLWQPETRLTFDVAVNFRCGGKECFMFPVETVIPL